MVFSIIGLMVGLIMGITGAGGAIIAIPLFQLFLDSTLKEATVLSLIAVVLGTAFNLPGQMREVKWKIAFGFLVSGAIASYLSLPLKGKTPEFVITLLLVAIGSFSIWTVFKAPSTHETVSQRTNLITVTLTGLLLGLITTLTGLGGGVLLIPILIRIFGMRYETALPTSLSSILLISSSSLLVQEEKALELIRFMDIVFIGVGAFTAFGVLRILLKSVNDKRRLQIRKTVFFIATLASLIIVILRTL